MKESRCRFEPPPEDDDFALEIFGEEDPFLVGAEIDLVPKNGFAELPKPEDAACYELDLRFGADDLNPFGEEPEEPVCCHIDNIEADLCDVKEGYACMEEAVRKQKFYTAFKM